MKWLWRLLERQMCKGLDFLPGEARFIGPKTLEVTLEEGDIQQITANEIFINVGAQPSALSRNSASRINIESITLFYIPYFLCSEISQNLQADKKM
jgi:pyruvate/2-oxoglutarate dehydrogenase complex dihydrolipoamide dehydrogenase (E3) component